MKHKIKVIQGVLGLLLSEGKGITGSAFPKQPNKLLELYEFEACPYCRRVRQVMTELNLDYIVYPCPKNGKIYRNEVLKLSGKHQFPFLVDPNTQAQIEESSDIIEYLFTTYGKKDAPPPARWENLSEAEIRGSVISMISLLRGMYADKNNRLRYKKGGQPEKLLELYSFEMSPYSRLVKERLCELELPFICRNLAKERWQDYGHVKYRLKPGKYKPKTAGKREFIMNKVMRGKMQVPFLIDPNTNVEIFESEAILKYINTTYKY